MGVQVYVMTLDPSMIDLVTDQLFFQVPSRVEPAHLLSFVFLRYTLQVVALSGQRLCFLHNALISFIRDNGMPISGQLDDDFDQTALPSPPPAGFWSLESRTKPRWSILCKAPRR